MSETAGFLLRFYLREDQRHQQLALWEWLLREANRLGIGGGSAFRSIGSFGRHHNVSEQHFFELAGGLGIEVQFAVTDAQGQQLLELMRGSGHPVFYVRSAAEFGSLNPQP